MEATATEPGLCRRAGHRASLPVLGSWPLWAVLPIAIVASAAFGAVWGVIPGYLQAKRGSHIVITTIHVQRLPGVGADDLLRSTC